MLMPPLYTSADATLFTQVGQLDLGRMQRLGEAQKLIMQMVSGEIGNMATVKQQTIFWDADLRMQLCDKLSELLQTQPYQVCDHVSFAYPAFFHVLVADMLIQLCKVACAVVSSSRVHQPVMLCLCMCTSVPVACRQAKHALL